MRTSCSLGSLLSIPQILECTNKIASTNTETIWIPETWGMENFSILSAISSKTVHQKIGSSIINIYSRSPSTIAMGAASVDILSKGRFILGLGASSMPIVEQFHGYEFDKPIQRMKEYVEIIRMILSGNMINYSGKIFNLKNFTLLIKPEQKNIPIYLAAINEKMVKLSWDIADGVIFYLRPKDEMRQTISQMQSKKKIDVACQLITCVSKDSDLAINKAKKTISFYIAVGKVYREFLEKNGFKNECENIFNEFKKSGFDSIHEQVTDSMTSSLCIAGTPDESQSQLKKFRETGINLPILQFNPIGDVNESFDLLKDTFLEAEI